MRKLTDEDRVGNVHYRCTDESCRGLTTRRLWVDLDCLLRPGGYNLALVYACQKCGEAAVLAGVTLPTAAVEQLRRRATSHPIKQPRGELTMELTGPEAALLLAHLFGDATGPAVENPDDVAQARALGIMLEGGDCGREDN